MDALRKSGDSVGARINVVATGVPAGWGEPVYDKLDADIASAMMGINAVKGVEIGAGSRRSRRRAARMATKPRATGFLSNNAGGVLGGISTGQEIVVSIAIKPTSSLRLPARGVDVARRKTSRSSPPAATTPASASAPRRSARRCWRWC